MSSLLQKKTALVIAPASCPRDMELYESSLARMIDWGLHISKARESLSNHGYLAGSDEERAAEFNHALMNPDIDLLICARGGYGTLRILDMIDYETAKKNPKILIGYSDITALQLALFKYASWKSISGPMPGVDWPELKSVSLSRLLQLFDAREPFDLIGPGDEELEPLHEGVAKGTLLGGNLSLITKIVGSPYLPDLSDAILFIEEVSEAPYQLDGHLAQLSISGQLDKISGLVCGQFTGWEADPEKATFSYKEVVKHYANKHDIPTAWNLQYGHIRDKNSMPIGVDAELIVRKGSARLNIKESIAN